MQFPLSVAHPRICWTVFCSFCRIKCRFFVPCVRMGVYTVIGTVSLKTLCPWFPPPPPPPGLRKEDNKKWVGGWVGGCGWVFSTHFYPPLSNTQINKHTDRSVCFRRNTNWVLSLLSVQKIKAQTRGRNTPIHRQLIQCAPTAGSIAACSRLRFQGRCSPHMSVNTLVLNEVHSLQSARCVRCRRGSDYDRAQIS